MLCRTPSCGCAIQSSTLNVSGAGSPSDPWIVEQAEFTDLTALELAVDALEAWQTTAMAEIAGLQTNVTTLIAALARLDLLAVSGASQAGATGPTVGTTPLVIATTTIGPFANAGTLLVWGTALFTKTLNTDVFTLTARVAATTVATTQDRTQQTAAQEVTCAGTAAVAAGASVAVDITLTRTSGTGTATTTAGVFNGRVVWLFIPT